MAPGLRYGIERQDLLELLGNLLVNACKWADGQVILSLKRVHGMELMIEDDGPGIEVGRGVDLNIRGTRLDERRPGHGLGLGIVQDLVDGYDGSISFERSAELGGLAVRVQFPD